MYFPKAAVTSMWLLCISADEDTGWFPLVQDTGFPGCGVFA